MSCQVVLLGFPLINKEGLEVLNVKDTPRYMRYMDYLIGQVFIKEAVEKGWTISDLAKPELFQEIYDKARIFLAKDYNLRKDNLTVKVKNDIIRIAKNWDIFGAYHSKYNSIAVTDDIYDEVLYNSNEEDNIEDDQKDEFDSTGNDKSNYELSSPNLKLLFRLLPKSIIKSIGEDIEIEDYLENDGLPSSADFSSLWNNLSIKLAGKKNSSDFINSLTSNDTIKIFPELKVLNKLLNVNGEKSKQQVQQFSEFYKVFTRPIVKLYMTKEYPNKNGVDYRFFEQLKGNREKIRSIFSNNFVTENIPENLKKHTVRDGEYNELRINSIPPIGNTSINDLNYLDVDINTVFKNEIDLLSLLGISLSGMKLIDSYNEKKLFIELLMNVRNVLHPNINQRLADGQILDNPIENLYNKYKNSNSNKNLIEQIINIESKYSSVAPTLMTTNSKGEPQSDLSNDNAITVSLYDLNNASTIDELYKTPSFIKAKYSPLFKNSRYLKFLFDKQGNKIPERSINVINYNGAKINNEEKVTRNFTEIQKRVVDLNNMLLYGVNDMMRTETSNSFYALQMIDENSKSLPFYIKDSFNNGSFLSNQSFKNDMLSYLNAELERIKNYESNPNDYISTPNYGKFSIFSDILSPELQSSLKESLSKENIDSFYQAIENYFIPQVNNFISKLESGNVKEFLSLDLKEFDLKNLVISFIANTFTSNVEMSATISGESLFFNDMSKRLKGLASTGALASTIDDINNFLNSNENNKAWNSMYSLSSALSKDIRNNSNNFKTQVINDVISTNNAYTTDVIKKGIQESIKLRDNKEISIQDVENMIKDGNTIKVSDGQGYITIDFHRELAFRFGFWTPEAEIAYEYEGMYFRKTNPSLKMPIDEKRFQELKKLIFENPSKYSIPTLKATYYGNVENEDVKVNAKAYDKFSLTPLIPSFIINHPELDSMNKNMVKNQLGYIKYESATKLYVRNKVNNQKIGTNADLYSTSLLKEQLKTSIKQKEESTIPTQFTKLIFANLFNEGKAINENVQKLFDEYISTLKNIQLDNQDRLLIGLGYEYKLVDGKYEITSFSPEKLFDKIQLEISRQKMSSNVSKALETVKDEQGQVKSFKYAPEATGVYSIINDYISGIIDKSLRRPKVNSADFVLISSANIQNKLKFYEYNKNGTIAAECKITLTKSFSSLLNKIHPVTKEPIETIEALNLLLKDKKWVKDNEKSLTVVFSRPPVGGPNSMGFAIVEEFISPTMGNVLMLPEEFIIKAGIDFDIDKEKTIMPLLSKNGDYVSTENISKIENQIKEYEQEYSELREYAAQYEADEDSMLDDNDKDSIDTFINKLFQRKDNSYLNPNQAVVDADDNIYRAYKDYFELKKLINNKHTNILLEQYIPILSLPELYSDLIIPNSTGMVKPLAAKNAKDLGRVAKGFVEEDGTVKLPYLGKVYEYEEQLRTFLGFFAAKSLLGAFAQDNTFQQLNTQNGLKLNKTYNDISKKGKVWRNRNINLLLFSPEQRDAITENNSILMGKRFNLDGKLIQHYNNEFINYTVDSGKDLGFSEYNLNWKNIGVFNLLKDMGLPLETLVNFINNPIILDYMNNRVSDDKNTSISKTLYKLGIGEKKEKDEEILVKLGTPGYSSIGKKLVKLPNDKNTYFKVIEKVVKTVPFSGKFDGLTYVFNEDVRNEGKYISPERLAQLKDNSNYKNATKDEKIEMTKDYIALLANFVEFENHSNVYSQFRRQYNYDTTKISSTFELRNKQNNYEKIRKVNLITSESLSGMNKNSIISAYMNNRIIKDMFSKIFTITNQPIVEDTLSRLYSEYDSKFLKSQKILRNLPKQLNNEFIRSIIDNYGEYENTNIIEYTRPLIAKLSKVNNLTLVDRLTNIRKLPIYNILVNEYPIFNNFISDIGIPTTVGIFRYVDKEGKINLSKPNNIRFSRNTTEIQSEIEGYIEQFKKLISPSLEIEGIKKEQIDKIRNLTKDLLIAGYYQSGFNKTFQGYNDLIPTEFVIDIYQDAIDKFSSLSEEDKELYMSEFYTKFKVNNPNVFPEYAKETVKDGKNYKIDFAQENKSKTTPIRKELEVQNIQDKEPFYIDGTEKSIEDISFKNTNIVSNTNTGVDNKYLEEFLTLNDKIPNRKSDEYEDFHYDILDGKYGEGAEIIQSNDAFLTKEQAEWLKNNLVIGNKIASLFEEDMRSSDKTIRQYIEVLLELNKAESKFTLDELKDKLPERLFDIINDRNLNYRYYDYITDAELEIIKNTLKMSLDEKQELEDFIDSLKKRYNENQLTLFGGILPDLTLDKPLDKDCN